MRTTGHLYDYLGDVGSIYHCPEDIGPFNNTAAFARDLSSYQFNGATSGYGNLRVGQTYTISNMRGDAIFMWETDETRIGGVWNDGGNRPDEGISRRHVLGAPVGFIDGSAAQMLYDEYYGIVSDPLANSLWCNPKSPNGRR